MSIKRKRKKRNKKKGTEEAGRKSETTDEIRVSLVKRDTKLPINFEDSVRPEIYRD